MNNPSKVESILVTALEKSTAEARLAYLDEACNDDPNLREQVCRLLAAHPHAAEFLEKPSGNIDEKTGLYHPTKEHVGSVIAGRYKLLEKIGEGGMGVVWVADQLEPIRRRVALKLIKPGMDSRAVLARFEAERQALALMDHPHIAKVLDAGTTADHLPFFVMELVKGTPITDFCDARKLSPRERLELFIPVCQAIQHAHTKGIIHRDIKPSNVLVALHDERPVAKVIDFGVSKAIGQQLTEKTLYTGFGALVGTPTYMAPEQATFNQLDVDTRADIYALGVLLYELLAGSPPVEPERVKKAALDEMLRLVREEEPPRPSQRLSTSQAKASIAAVRQSDPTKLSKLIQGELDWIVMKALEKDRNRRYETANGFAADVQRYLAGEQVQAVPPSATYRMRKFARKNRAMLATVAAFVGLIVLAAGVSACLAIMARQAEAVARYGRLEAEKNAARASEAEQRASRNYGMAIGATWAADEDRQKSQLFATNVQIDLDLAALESSRVDALLQLAKTLTNTPQDFRKTIETEDFSFKSVEDEVEAGVRRSLKELREFLTMAALTIGQEFAPLLPPIMHDGQRVDFMKLSSDSQRLVTGSVEGTVRLWDTKTGIQIAKLQRDNERVTSWQISPDGKTVATDDEAGVVRFWSTDDGAFRASTEIRPLRTVLPKDWPVHYSSTQDQHLLSDNRLLTRNLLVTDEHENGSSIQLEGPIELWDTQTGRLIARLDHADISVNEFRMLEDGRTIATIESESTVLLFSAEDGRLLARLEHPQEESIYSIHVSPEKKSIATVSKLSDLDHFARIWDYDNLQSPPRIVKLGPHGGFLFWTESMVTTSKEGSYESGFRIAFALQDFQRLGAFYSIENPPLIDELLLLNGSQVYDSRSWQRLTPPAGKKLHPAVARFAKDGRFLLSQDYRGDSLVIDTTTEKQIVVSDSWAVGSNWGDRTRLGTLPGLGHVWGIMRANGVELRIIPFHHDTEFPASLLELWAQVVVRGQLNDQGEFVQWTEAEWENKRQELAAIPPPIKDFPFPGYVASDKLHWLRAEYHATTDEAKKESLARDLLERAQTLGDKNEAARWRNVLKVNQK